MAKPYRLFLLDANVFIAAYRSYYAFSLCPGFWCSLIYYCRQGRLLSIDRVSDELIGSGDALADWVRAAPPELFTPSTEGRVIAAYQEIISWVNANDQFQPQAKNDFSRGADGWLVAYAREHNGTVVTQERYAPNVRQRVPIPNVCDQFDVARRDTFEMLRDLGVSFNWEP